jgi:cyclopropane fatty-acyl-phospholipid synthase-like methyltransferase
MGRIATAQLADLVQITPDDEVLDAGSEIGGTARYIAERSRCHDGRTARQSHSSRPAKAGG